MHSPYGPRDAPGVKRMLLSLKCDLVACHGLMTGMQVGIMVVLSTKTFVTIVKKLDSNHLLFFHGKAQNIYQVLK